MSAESLRGDLRHFFPAEILQLLQLAQASGRLALERQRERAEIFVERGQPVLARTSGPTAFASPSEAEWIQAWQPPAIRAPPMRSSHSGCSRGEVKKRAAGATAPSPAASSR